jgi:hypothetical protein
MDKKVTFLKNSNSEDVFFNKTWNFSKINPEKEPNQEKMGAMLTAEKRELFFHSF